MWTTHTEICSSGLIRQEAQSSCSDTTAELLIKQCIAHWEHCKPQLIRVCPLYFINTYCCGLNLKQISMLVLHHFLLNLCMFPVPWLKVSELRERLREREGGGKEEWPSCMSCMMRGGKRGDWTAVAWQPPQAPEEVAQAAAGRLMSRQKQTQRTRCIKITTSTLTDRQIIVS